MVTTYNAWAELWLLSHHITALELAQKNISNGVGVEQDYLVAAIVKRRMNNTDESNSEVLGLLNKAQKFKSRSRFNDVQGRRYHAFENE